MAKKDKKEKLEIVETKKGKNKKNKGGTTNKAKGIIEVDFSKEIKKEGGGGRWLKRVAEGDYLWDIQSMKQERANSGNKMLTVIFIGKEGRVKGQQTRDRFVLVPQSLFKLRQLLEAAGHEVPDDTLRIPMKELIGSTVGGTLRDGDEYEGKIRSELAYYMPPEDVVSPDDESPKKSKKDKGGKSKKGKGKKSKDDLEDLDLDNI